MASKRELLEELLAPVVESLGCELWGIDYQTHGRNALLRIYIDSERGIAVEDCEKVSRQVSAVMDVEDPINSRYTLEVSSPGMDRPLYKLEQYQRFIGAQVELRLRMPLDGQRKWRGLLAGVEGDEIVLRIDSENEYLLPIDSIERANIVPQFEGGQK
ncbi:ribosome maturation factor RimP [Microbulbifer salipaludis]|uniref:Ribosome maturation factor RimP n=1 Tax=Microbulbifer salipaludis TaxID=187980 RepID=A0ABS3E5M7_9GAMM|nr:ribosome maturation factor RimP [Microbulbifer salipaludis]MBN8430612.1 ribosome maturation factor RimP [Microbulbifer salipaludis]